VPQNNRTLPPTCLQQYHIRLKQSYLQNNGDSVLIPIHCLFWYHVTVPPSTSTDFKVLRCCILCDVFNVAQFREVGQTMKSPNIMRGTHLGFWLKDWIIKSASPCREVLDGTASSCCIQHCYPVHTHAQQVIEWLVCQPISLSVCQWTQKWAFLSELGTLAAEKPRFHSSSYNACTIFSVVTYKLEEKWQWSPVFDRGLHNSFKRERAIKLILLSVQIYRTKPHLDFNISYYYL